MMFGTMSRCAVQAALRQRGLSGNGTKAELVERLEKAFAEEQGDEVGGQRWGVGERARWGGWEAHCAEPAALCLACPAPSPFVRTLPPQPSVPRGKLGPAAQGR